MVDDKTKTKLLKELEKTGNVFYACTKVGIARATFYRWLKIDKSFRKSANQLIRLGRENMSDIGEHALLLKVKDGDINAIKYLLSHNSQHYKPRMLSKVILEHRRKIDSTELPKAISIEDIMDQYMLSSESNILSKSEQNRHPTPNAPGTPIILEEES